MLRSPRLKKHLKKRPAQPTFGNTRMVPPKRKQFHIAAVYFDHSRRVRTKTNRNRNDSKTRCKSILFHPPKVFAKHGCEQKKTKSKRPKNQMQIGTFSTPKAFRKTRVRAEKTKIETTQKPDANRYFFTFKTFETWYGMPGLRCSTHDLTEILKRCPFLTFTVELCPISTFWVKRCPFSTFFDFTGHYSTLFGFIGKLSLLPGISRSLLNYNETRTSFVGSCVKNLNLGSHQKQYKIRQTWAS